MTKFAVNECHFASIEMFFFHDHERIQFSHKFRRLKSFDAHYSKAHFKTQSCEDFRKNETNQKVCYEK